MTRKLILSLILLTIFSESSRAWVYPEHRDITLIAIRNLDGSRRAELDKMWAAARKGYEKRLSELVADPGQGLRPVNLDYAAWSAIGGDHSRSPGDMLAIVLESEWIMKVADIAADLKKGIATPKYESERINQLRASDIKLLRADPEYVSRAGANNGHFMMALPDVQTTAAAYFDSCFRMGCPLNTIGTYTWFHLSALLKAKRLSRNNLTPEQRNAISLSALADEAFALHFLEDSFASGHVAGVWGNASQRKGTHDYYNEAGLQVITWNGERMILMGDAYMRKQDAERAAFTVRLSLEQMLDAAIGSNNTNVFNGDINVSVPDTFDVSRAEIMPYRATDMGLIMLINQVLVTTPVPGLATGLGAMPRFHSELGPFVGIAPAITGSIVNGGFSTTQVTGGIVPGLEVAVRLGLGMEGVLNESGDGLAFLDLGWHLDGASSMTFDNEPALKQFGTYASAIPSRDAYYARLRLPFCLIPGDLLICGPVLLLASPKTLNKMIVAAGNGGLIPWQSGFVTAIGRFQFVLGREVGICLYGSGNGPDSFLLPREADYDQVLVTMYTTQLNFPILEYRLLRNYASRQSASLMLQLHGGLDIPGKKKVIYPENSPAPDVKNVWFVGLRVVFDWRYYFTGRQN